MTEATETDQQEEPQKGGSRAVQAVKGKAWPLAVAFAGWGV